MGLYISDFQDKSERGALIAKSEDEVWKIVNDKTKPREDAKWTLKEGEKIINDEKEMADLFLIKKQSTKMPDKCIIKISDKTSGLHVSI